MINTFLKERYKIDSRLIKLSDDVIQELKQQLAEVDKVGEYNQLKVLKAMQDNKLSDAHFFATTGYGYNDIGRDTLEKIYASVFNTEAALVRPQIISGTHAITLALFGNLKYGDEILSPIGEPYDTIQGVIGIRETRGSLKEWGVSYSQVDLKEGDLFDYETIEKSITNKTKIAIIQRSKGYSLRRSFSVSDISNLIAFIKNIKRDLICMVDNCYGEFTEYYEPSDYGADLVVGSLIKNPGGGIASVGGYIVGKQEYVDNAAVRLTAPGLGREVGPTLGITQSFLQGLFLAPQTVCGALKGAIFAAGMCEKLGYETFPKSNERRTDIVQAINMKNTENIIAFCKGIQAAAPVDSFVSPEPWEMPGYDSKVIMAAGAFVQGASVELSADAPIKPPYTVFLQGGLTFAHAKNGVLIALNNMKNNGGF